MVNVRSYNVSIDLRFIMVNLDGILYKVTKPARYTGGEWNSVVKDWESAQIRIALSYPDQF